MADYQNFELKIEALDGDKLRVTLAGKPPVVLEIASPVTDDEVARVNGLLEGSVRIANSERTKLARSFGEKLFNAIFSGPIYAAYSSHLDHGLRILLNLDNAGKYADLPWELLRDPRTDFLSLSRQTSLIRAPRGPKSKAPIEVTLPLHSLVMIAAPADQPLNVQAEWHTLQESTHETQGRGLLQLDVLDDAQQTTLKDKLGSKVSYQIFHYNGFAQDDGVVLEDTDLRKTTVITNEALAKMLTDENTIRLVILQARGATADLPASLLARGIPAVVTIGDKGTLSADASRLFVNAFYSAIAEGQPVEIAISDARAAMNSSLNNLEWAVPLVYLNSPSGILFPRRGTGSVSTGGLLEVIRTRALILLGVLAVLIIAGFVILPRLPKPTPPIATATTAPGVTPSGTPGNVDLIVTALRYFPANPSPGELVTGSMVIKNQGTDRSAKFQVAWYAGDTPTIIVDENGLDPNAADTIPVYFIFGGWKPGGYVTQAVVNYGNLAPETNIANNTRSAILTIGSDKQFKITFNQLPNPNSTSDPDPTITDPTILKGDEFASWGLHFLPDTTSSGCAKAVLTIQVEPEDNYLVVNDTTNSSNATCGVSLQSDQAFGGAKVDFIAAIPGNYTISLFDSKGTPVGTPASTKLTVTQAGANSISISKAGGDIHKVLFQGPGTLTIAQFTLSYPGTPIPTPNGS